VEQVFGSTVELSIKNIDHPSSTNPNIMNTFLKMDSLEAQVLKFSFDPMQEFIQQFFGEQFKICSKFF
jgi:hypothetical protein